MFNFNSKEGSAGIYDAFNYKTVWKVMQKSREAKIKMWDIVLFNGFIYLGTVILFESYIAPYIHSIFTITTEYSWFAYICTTIKYFFIMTYYLLWIIPVFGLSFVINPSWLTTISESSFQVLTNKPPPSIQFKGINELPKQVASELYTITFYVMFILQTTACNLINWVVPTLGTTLNMLLLCWLYSLYSFEYKWAHWNISKRLRYIEDHWPYFVAFGFIMGTPFNIASYYYGTWTAYAIWGLEFPLFVIMAIGANVPHDAQVEGQVRFGLFKLAKALNTQCLNWLVSIIKYTSGSK